MPDKIVADDAEASGHGAFCQEWQDVFRHVTLTLKSWNIDAVTNPIPSLGKQTSFTYWLYMSQDTVSIW